MANLLTMRGWVSPMESQKPEALDYITKGLDYKNQKDMANRQAEQTELINKANILNMRSQALQNKRLEDLFKYGVDQTNIADAQAVESANERTLRRFKEEEEARNPNISPEEMRTKLNNLLSTLPKHTPQTYTSDQNFMDMYKLFGRLIGMEE